MTVEFTNITFNAKVSGTWIGLNDDMMAEPRPRWNMGIMGNKTLDRVGDPEILTFALNNSSSNSAGLNGYYTIGHANQWAGWGPGCPVLLTITYDGIQYAKYYGWIAPDGIVAETGTSGTRIATVTCVGFMGKAAEHIVHKFFGEGALLSPFEDGGKFNLTEATPG